MGFNLSNQKKKIKFKGAGFIFITHDGFVSEGELLWENNKIYYGRKLSNGNIEKVELVNIDKFNSTVQQQHIQYSFYPFESKDNWFMLDGICRPAFIPYQFALVQLKIGVIPTQALVGGNNSAYDKMGSIGSPVVVTDTPGVSGLILKEYNVNTGFAANSTTGLYFNGKVITGPRQLQLRVNNSIITNIDMEDEGHVEDGGGGTPLNKLYCAELVIQPHTGIVQGES